MMRLKSYREVPPDNYRYVHPETGHVTRASDVVTWEAEARKHLIANNLSIPENLLPIMEDQLCQTLPPEWCIGVDPNRPYVDLRMSWSDVMKGVEVFASWLAGGSKTVSQDEANRRARICVGCYANTNVEGCFTCHKIAGLLTWSNTTPYDDSLKACGVCKCALKAKVHFPQNILDKSHTEVQNASWPSFCWNKINAENYVPAS